MYVVTKYIGPCIPHLHTFQMYWYFYTGFSSSRFSSCQFSHTQNMRAHSFCHSLLILTGLGVSDCADDNWVVINGHCVSTYPYLCWENGLQPEHTPSPTLGSSCLAPVCKKIQARLSFVSSPNLLKPRKGGKINIKNASGSFRLFDKCYLKSFQHNRSIKCFACSSEQRGVFQKEPHNYMK